MFFYSVEISRFFRYSAFFTVIFFSVKSHCRAQVLFKKPVRLASTTPGQDPWVVRTDIDSSAEQSPPKPVFRVTYMGQPVADGTFSPGDSLLTLAVTPADDAAARADSLIALRLLDSLRQLRTLVPVLQASLRADTDRLAARSYEISQLYRTIPSILPVSISSPAEFRVSSAYGQRVHPVTGQPRTHAGIDLPQPRLSPVFATADGFVDRIIWEPGGLGLAVFIAHESGYQTGYGHLEDHSVLVGQSVSRGQVIGRVGTTGLSTGPHLHYTVLAGALAVDPAGYCFLLANALNQRKKTNRRNAGQTGEVRSSTKKRAP